MSKEQKLEYNW